MRSKPPSKAALAVFGIAVALAIVSCSLSGEENSNNQVQYDAYGMPTGGGDFGAAMNPMRGLTLSRLMGRFVLVIRPPTEIPDIFG